MGISLPKWQTIKGYAGWTAGVGVMLAYLLALPWVTTGGGTPEIKRILLLPADHGGPLLVALLDRDVGSDDLGDVNPVQVLTWDLRTGTRRGTLSLGWQDTEYLEDHLFQPAGDHAWFRNPHLHGLELLDLRKPALLLSPKELVAHIPALADGYHVDDDVADQGQPQPDIGVTLHDGRQGWIDQEPAFVTKSPPAEPRRLLCPSCTRSDCFGFADAGSSDAVVLGHYRLQQQARPASADASPLFHPELVHVIGTECRPFEVDGDTLVLRESAALEPSETLVSLLDSGGHIRWTVKLSRLTHHLDSKAVGAVGLDHGIGLLLSHDDETLEYARFSMDGELLAHGPLL